MPFTSKDATKHTKSANTDSKRKKWARVANGVLRKSGDEGKAIRIANLSVKT